MRFSEQYGVTRGEEDDWLEVLLTQDTRLFPDPFLIYEDTAPSWRGAHDHLLEFFALVLALLKTAGSARAGLAYGKASNLLLFPEPAEFCLGFTEAGVRGSGSAQGLRADMLDGAHVALNYDLTRLEHIETLMLFHGGIGADRVGDIVCNVLKGYFIRYTQQVARRHGIPLTPVRVTNAEWSEEHARWVNRVVDLPVNPYAGRRPLGVLLCPERFLRPLPTADPDDFWAFAASDENAEIRADFGYDVASRAPAKVPRHLKRQLARIHPELVLRYLKRLETQPRQPYDLAADPALLTRWYDEGKRIADSSALTFVPDDPADFARFVATLVSIFSHALEETDAWRLLWAENKPRGEREVQALFRAMVTQYCRAHQVILTSESNAGRGPVDFKFTAGWEAQALVELKLTDNTKFWDGLRAQTPQYMRSETISHAIFAAVGFRARDFEPDYQQRVRDAAASVSTETSQQIDVVFIDARPKEPASKLKG